MAVQLHGEYFSVSGCGLQWLVQFMADCSGGFKNAFQFFFLQSILCSPVFICQVIEHSHASTVAALFIGDRRNAEEKVPLLSILTLCRGFKGVGAFLFKYFGLFSLIGRCQVRWYLVGQVLWPFADDTVSGQAQYLFGEYPVTPLVNTVLIFEVNGVGNGVDQGIHQLEVAAESGVILFPLSGSFFVLVLSGQQLIVGVFQ